MDDTNRNEVRASKMLSSYPNSQSLTKPLTSAAKDCQEANVSVDEVARILPKLFRSASGDESL